MDVLSDVLDLLKFKGVLYFRTDLTAPWGITVPAYQNVARFHLAVGGECWVEIEGQLEPVRLNAGDMILIPHGKSHTLKDHPDTQSIELDQVLEQSGYDGGGYFVHGGQGDARGNLVCGHLEFNEMHYHPILAELPDYILITGRQAIDFSWFDNAMKFMSYETQTGNMGNQAITKRLAEILFIHAVRVWNVSLGEKSGFVNAVADKNIGRSLQVFHGKLEERWTIQMLANEAGLSRSVFANQFREMVGLTPMQYVTMWRMQKACHHLDAGVLTTEAVADQVGYQSLAAFSKVFKKHIGIGPGSYKRAGGQAARA